MSFFHVSRAILETMAISLPTIVQGASGKLTPEVCDSRLENWSKRLLKQARVDLVVTGREDRRRGDLDGLAGSEHQGGGPVVEVGRSVPPAAVSSPLLGVSRLWPLAVLLLALIVRFWGIDWQLPAARIHDLIRGLQPWPLVSASLNDVRYLLHRSQLTAQTVALPGGSVVAAEGGELLVAGGDGAVLRILQIQPEGKRSMTARELLSGRRIEAGARFERP